MKLNQNFINNTLNKQFYNELLHILGICEKTIENKVIIDRLPIHKRNEGSLLENTINILQTENSLQNIENLADFGETQEEQLFSLAIELCIIWLNRILFLKLLESQLICYEEHTIPPNSTLKDTTIEKIKEIFLFSIVLKFVISMNCMNCFLKFWQFCPKIAEIACNKNMNLCLI